MNNLRLMIASTLIMATAVAGAQKRTVLSAEVYGYKQEMNYFDCVQTPTVAAEFHNNPGEEHHHAFTTRFSPVVIRINGRAEVLMNAGDSIYAIVKREDKNVNVTYAGTPTTVAANNMRQEMTQVRRQMNYKSQLLACVAVGVKPDARINGAKELLKQTVDVAKKYEGKANKELIDYIKAEQEASAYMSFMEYPMMYAEVRKQPIEEQGIGDYWKLMDGVKLRDDDAAMACPDYASFLMRYCFYANKKKALESKKEYTMPNKLETMFAEIKDFYQGKQRELTLYTLLTNFIRNGKEIERALPLYDEFKQLNNNQAYTEVLDHLLQ